MIGSPLVLLALVVLVMPVGGPGSPGVLFVEGEKFNVRRFYAPPVAPYVVPQPRDFITYDQNGEPIINRPIGPLAASAPTSVVPGVPGLVGETVVGLAQISPSQLKKEAERGAVAAGRQLDQDVDMIKLINKARKAFNELVMAAAKDATGQDGETPSEWRQKLAGKGFSTLPPSAKPTYGEMVELEYNPVFGPVGFTARSVLNVNTMVDT